MGGGKREGRRRREGREVGGIFGGARLINCSAQSARPISRGFFTSKSIGDNQRHFNQERDTWLNLEPGTCSQLEWLINQLKATSNWTTSKRPRNRRLKRLKRVLN